MGANPERLKKGLSNPFIVKTEAEKMTPKLLQALTEVHSVHENICYVSWHSSERGRESNICLLGKKGLHKNEACDRGITDHSHRNARL